MILIASAVSEEIVSLYHYFEMRYIPDNVMQETLCHSGIPLYIPHHTVCDIPMNADGFGYARKYIQPYSAKVYRIKNEILILMHTGYGGYMVEYVLEKIFSLFVIDVCFFVGTCLGISKGLIKGDCITHADVYVYEDEHSFQQYKKDLQSRKSRIIAPIIVSGNTFINVQKRKKMGYDESNMLPQNIQRCIDEAYQHTLQRNIVLDMESGFVNRFIGEYQNHNNMHPIRFEVMRVVLDTIYDERKVDYRKDIPIMSDMIRDYCILALSM